MIVDDATGKVRESWTGYQIAWQMARGYPDAVRPQAERSLCLAAARRDLPVRAVRLAPQVAGRPPRPARPALRSASRQIFFNAGNIGVSVPLAYPPLVYLLARMLWVGFRGAGEGLRPSAPDGLAGDRRRVPARLSDRAQHRRLGRHRRRLCGRDRRRPHHARPDRLGPERVPLRQSLRRHLRPLQLLRLHAVRARAALAAAPGTTSPAAHAAAIVFDLATVGGLFVLGRRLQLGGGPASASSSASPGPPIRSPTTRCSRTPTTRWSPRSSSGRSSSSAPRSSAARCSRSRRSPSSPRWCSRPCSPPASVASRPGRRP